MASSEITLEAVPSVSDIPAAEWDACANPKPDPDSFENLDTLASPGAAGDSCADFKIRLQSLCFARLFCRRRRSGSACARTGWGPRHLLARLDGKIAGIVPCYLKSHSQGEYVFDRGWADAYERAGGRYYPKLQVSVPFTPGDRTAAADPRRRRTRADRDRAGQRPDGAVQHQQGLVGARHLSPRGGSEVSRRATASCSAPTSSFTGTTTAMRRSTISSPPSIPATAKRSSASAAKRWPPASPSTG